jgi:hypothetical protein
MGPPSFLAVQALQLDDHERMILQNEGLDGLMKAMIRNRGYHEALHFTYAAVTTILPLFYGGGLSLGLIRDPIPNADAGVCSKDSTKDGYVLSDPNMGLLNPFDAYFIGPLREPGFEGKPNPCDADGSVKAAYERAQKEIAQKRLSDPKYSLSEFLLQHDTRDLLNKIRANYRNVATGCCIHYSWSFDNPEDEDLKTNPDSSPETLSIHQ